MPTATWDGFTYYTEDPAFLHSIARGESEPYPKQIEIVRRWLRQFPHLNRTFVDVGAHIGTTMLPYSRMFQKVIGYEATDRTYQMLQRNLEANRAVNCETRNVGVWSETCRGEMVFPQRGGANSGCFFFKKSEAGVGPVGCVALDDEGLDRVDFLKIDVEGAELMVLQGAEKLLRKWTPLVQFENNNLSQDQFGIAGSEAVAFLRGLGYIPYDLTDSANEYWYCPHDGLMLKPGRVVSFWTGVNPMSADRLKCLEEFNDLAQMSDHLLIRPDDLRTWILSAAPLHPAYPYLSEVHKADYLRTYFMHFYGGGYTDIKRATQSWGSAWAAFRENRAAEVCGYQEIGPNGVAVGPGTEWLADHWQELLGNGAYLVRPNTEFTRAWYGAMIAFLDEKLEALRASPAKSPRDRNDSGTGYPIGWNEMLGRIFHRVCYDRRDKILIGLPAPVLTGYL
jgi:FkbM family methyltransferase